MKWPVIERMLSQYHNSISGREAQWYWAGYVPRRLSQAHSHDVMFVLVRDPHAIREAGWGGNCDVASGQGTLVVIEVVNRQRQAFAVIEAYVTLAMACSWRPRVVLWSFPHGLSVGQSWRHGSSKPRILNAGSTHWGLCRCAPTATAPSYSRLIVASVSYSKKVTCTRQPKGPAIRKQGEPQRGWGAKPRTPSSGAKHGKRKCARLITPPSNNKAKSLPWLTQVRA
jgi:hypothetical protein